MKVVAIYEAGGPKQLKLTEVPKPHIKEEWSLIKIKAFDLNHSEFFYKERFISFGKIPENIRNRMCRRNC